MYRNGLFLSVLLCCLLIACDDGRIYEEAKTIPEEGRVVKITGRINGIDSWSSGYSVVVAGFDEKSDYAIISKTVPTTENLSKGFVLAGINEDVTRIELCVTNRLRKRILTLRKFDCPVTPDTIRLDVGSMDVGMFASIQKDIFNKTCANCHGASNFAAAGLYLTEGKSYDALVGHPSTKEAGKKIVMKGNAEESVLYKILSTDISKDWKYDHTKEILSDEWIDIVKNWIDYGAKK